MYLYFGFLSPSASNKLNTYCFSCPTSNFPTCISTQSFLFVLMYKYRGLRYIWNCAICEPMKFMQFEQLKGFSIMCTLLNFVKLPLKLRWCCYCLLCHPNKSPVKLPYTIALNSHTSFLQQTFCDTLMRVIKTRTARLKAVSLGSERSRKPNTLTIVLLGRQTWPKYINTEDPNLIYVCCSRCVQFYFRLKLLMRSALHIFASQVGN